MTKNICYQNTICCLILLIFKYLYFIPILPSIRITTYKWLNNRERKWCSDNLFKS